jgi:hypothetical protein
MPEIPEITSPNIDIGEIKIQSIPTVTENYTSIPFAPPVVVNIGVPVVDIPGCVEAHETNNPKNNQIKSDDERGLVTFCDAGVPSFNPIQFEPEQMILTEPAPIPKTKTPDPPETPEVKPPKTEAPAATAKVECPTKVQQAQEPVGSFVEGFRKKVVGYELIDNTCVQITEKVPLPQQIVAGLPSGGQVVQVGGVAVIATTSALLAKPLADLLLKAVKPAVKKVMKKIASLRGKKPPVVSSGDRRAEQRQMNHAVKELRSVFPRRKKKRKG